MSQKQVMPKSEDLSRSLEINAIWTFDTEFPTIFNKSCTYITFKSAVKHRQLGYGYPRWQKKFRANFFYITLTYKKDTILFISISVISKIHRAISLFYPYLYTLIYVSLFLNSSFFWLAKYWGGNCPPPLPPCSNGHATTTITNRNQGRTQEMIMSAHTKFVLVLVVVVKS